MQKRSQLILLAKRDRIADLSLRDWSFLYQNFRAFLRELPTRKRRRAVASLQSAHKVLQPLVSAMRSNEFFPEITIGTKDRLARLNVVDFLAGGSLLSVADWLGSWEPSTGQPPLKSIIAQAALELAEISRSTIGKPDSAWIDERIKNQFGEDAPTGKSLSRLTRKCKEKKTGRLKQRRQKQAFKLFADKPKLKTRVASTEEVDAVFNLLVIRNTIRQRSRESVGKSLPASKQGNQAKNFIDCEICLHGVDTE